MKRLTDAKQKKGIDLRTIDEGGVDEKTDDKPARTLLSGFKQANIKIHLLAGESIKELLNKKKYTGLFDLGVLSTHSANFVEDCTTLFKHRAPVHIESGDALVILKPDQKVAFRGAIAEKCKKAGWKRITPAPFSHHMLFEVQNESQLEMEASTQASQADKEEDFLDLSNLWARILTSRINSF